MPLYRYTAKNINGKSIRGKAEAESESALVLKLKGRGLYLLSCEVLARAEETKRLSARHISQFNYEIGTMLSSGISLIRSLEILLRQDMPKRNREIYTSVYRQVLSGKDMSGAMEAMGGVFPELLINMYRAGEANGTLDVTALRMAEHYDKENRLRNKIKSAAAYPAILLILTLGVIVLIFTVVLPNFIAVYGNMELPGITKAALSISDVFTKHYMVLILAVLGLVLLFRTLGKNKKVRYKLDRMKLKLPVIGRLMRTIYTARFARTLSSLYASGLTVLSALQAVRGTVGNEYIASQFDGLVNDVRNGVALSEALDKIDGYDPKLASTVLVGEESGKLEGMLLSVAGTFDYEAEEATQRLAAMIEPALIIIMAVIVGLTLIAVMLPIYNSYSTLGL